MRTRMTTMLAAALAVGLTLGLGACDGQPPEPQAASAEVDQMPDLTPEQEQKIRTAVLETLDKATQDMNGEGLGARVTGPMLEVRNSAITVGKATGGLDKTNTIPTDMMQTVIPTDSGWPRTMYTITTTTEDQQSQRLLVFTQDSPRQNYKLWGVARLFPGAQLPRFTVPEIGTQMGLPNDTGLVATPQEAVERYADVLQNGSNSEFADQFADDSLRQTIASVAQTVQEGMERNNGTQSQTFTAVPDAIKIMRSSDGGDLVVVRGAFTRRITTIAVDRIQTVAIRRTLIRRALHLCSVRLGLGAVATAEGEDADSTGADVLPVIGDDRVYAVLQRMLPEWELVPPRMRRTGRGLLRYYLFTPLAVSTIGMVGAAIWALASGDAMAWLWMLVPAALMVWWGLCRCLKAAAEGYALPDGRRIVAAGATVLTLFTVFTRRSRIQSVERSTTPWRQRRGVESLTLPLFVSNGINTLRFTALRSADAATLAAWAEHGLVRADTSPGRRVDATAGGMVDNGYVQDDEWRTR